MNKELKILLDFIDITVKGALLNANDKERLAQWREDREKLYSALERKEKLEKVIKIIKKKIVNFRYILNDNLTLEDYNEAYSLASRSLEKEEFDLLKEMI